MKKILSALVLGAMAAGIATAELSIGLNYRNGIDVFKYVNKGYDGRTVDEYGNVYDDSGYENNGATSTLFNLTGWNSGKDSVSLKASGDIFSFSTTIQPTTGADAVIFHIMRIGAEYGNFFANVGWTGDGIMNYRNTKDNGNTEGKVWESYKLGGAFSGTIGESANNQVGFGNPGRNFFAYAGYSFVFNDNANMKAQATIISDRAWDNPSAEARGGNLGWAIFLQPKVKKVFDAEVFAKFGQDANNEWDMVFGAYGRPLVTPLIGDGGIGGSVVLHDGHVQEWNVDVRLWFEINENLTITTDNKFSKLVSNDHTPYSPTDGGTIRTAMAGLTAFKSSQILWDMVGVRYKLNKTVTLVGSVGQITDLDSGFNNGRESADGTQIFFYPGAQFFANGKVSVHAGLLAAFGGIGADKDANKDVDILFNIPVLIRVRM